MCKNNNCQLLPSYFQIKSTVLILCYPPVIHVFCCEIAHVINIWWSTKLEGKEADPQTKQSRHSAQKVFFSFEKAKDRCSTGTNTVALHTLNTLHTNHSKIRIQCTYHCREHYYAKIICIYTRIIGELHTYKPCKSEYRQTQLTRKRLPQKNVYHVKKIWSRFSPS